MTEKKPKLYIRKDNGRYEEYREPPRPTYDNALYKRVGKRYEPCQMCLSGEFSWQEGVFAVVRTHGHATPNSWTSADYLQKLYKLYRCGDIEQVSIGKLAGMDKLANYLAQHWSEIEGLTVYEKAASVVAILMSFEEETNK